MDDFSVNYRPSRSFLPHDSLTCFDFNPATDLNDDPGEEIVEEEEYYEEEELIIEEEIVDDDSDSDDGVYFVSLKDCSSKGSSRSNSNFSSNASTGSEDYSYYTVADLSTIMEQGESQCTMSEMGSLHSRMSLDMDFSSRHSRRSIDVELVSSSSRHQRNGNSHSNTTSSSSSRHQRKGPSLLSLSNSYRTNRTSMVGEEICCDYDESLQNSGLLLNTSSHHQRTTAYRTTAAGASDFNMSFVEEEESDASDSDNEDEDDSIDSQASHPSPPSPFPSEEDLYSKHTVSTSSKSHSNHNKSPSSSTHQTPIMQFCSVFDQHRAKISLFLASKLLQKDLKRLEELQIYPRPLELQPSVSHTRYLAFEDAKAKLFVTYQQRMSPESFDEYLQGLDARKRLHLRARRQLAFFVARHKAQIKIRQATAASAAIRMRRTRSRRVSSTQSMTAATPLVLKSLPPLPSPRSVMDAPYAVSPTGSSEGGSSSSVDASSPSMSLRRKRVQRSLSEQKLRSLFQQHLHPPVLSEVDDNDEESSTSSVSTGRAKSGSSTSGRPRAPRRTFSSTTSRAELHGFSQWKSHRRSNLV